MKSKIITFEAKEDLTYRLGRLVLFAELPIDTVLFFCGTLMTKKGEYTANQYFEDGRVLKNNLHGDIYVFIHEVEYKHIKESKNG